MTSSTLSNPELYQQLEFDKIIQKLQDQCLGQAAKTRLETWPLQTDPYRVEALLQQTEEYLDINQIYGLPMAAYQDLSQDLRLLAIEGYVLAPERLTALAQLIYLSQEIIRFFEQKKDFPKRYPNLSRLVATCKALPELLQALRRVVDEAGQIRPDASPELQRIVRMQQSKQLEIDKRFRQIAGQYQSKNMLADNAETLRNGRRVLAVPAEYKRQVRGILHDESGSGRTAFIEPEELIDLNNDLFDLFQEEKRELYRILRELCHTLRPEVEELEAYQELIIRLDLIQTRAALAASMRAVKPKIHAKPYYKLEQARHPLLWLKNQASPKKVVPFDLILDEKQRILVLSGPNAGGKSVTLKALGLMQLMLQAGLLLPLGEGSEMGVVEDIFTDIGDQQSLEDELSTYSSRLRKARLFLEGASSRSLVLIDEFGSGTDPQMGGAIAEAILRKLNRLGVYGLVTTHYGNLKQFAFDHAGLVNGSMIFDTETLNPTYRLQVGQPGSSYAFEIATKTGLASDIIDYARRRLGRKEADFEAMLIDVQREQKALLEAKESLEAKQKELNHLIKNYEHAHRELEFGRKKLKLQLKEQELVETRKTQSELQQVMQELRQAENARLAAEKAKALLESQQHRRQDLSQKVGTIKEEIYKIYQERGGKKTIDQGSTVRLLDGGSVGKVVALRKQNALIELDNLSLEVPIRDLEPVDPVLDVKQGPKKIQKQLLPKTVHFEDRLDIRGLRFEEALDLIQEFLDHALLDGSSQVSIVHGKGAGALRKAVQQKLKEYRAAKKVWHPEPHLGGEGVTMIEFQ